MTDLETAFRAIAEQRRRLAIASLLEHRLLTLADLAEEVTEREAGARIDALSEEQVTETYFSLYHTHVPTLEDADLVQYDQELDVVRLTDCAVSIVTSARDHLDTLLADHETTSV